eukprot:8039-Heterococcus_DN1.PRE.3
MEQQRKRDPARLGAIAGSGSKKRLTVATAIAQCTRVTAAVAAAGALSYHLNHLSTLCFVCVDGVRILDVFTVQLLLHSLCLYQSNVARALYACIASCTATAYWSSYVIA